MNGVYKRTFEALNYPKGSKQRKTLNNSIISSEYCKQYKFCAIGDNYRFGFKTKKEAEHFYTTGMHL